MKSGIYEILNTINKKKYIGSTKDFNERKKRHWYDLRNNRHINQHLQSAWNKYGESAFVFSPIIYCGEEHLLEVEQVLLNRNKNGYNIATDAEAPHKGKRHRPESIEKMRQAKIGKKRTPETIEKMRLGNLGRKQSTETKEKQRKAQLGRKYPPETIERMRQANIGKNLGRKRTPETKAKMRQSRLAYFQRIKEANAC